MNNKERAIEELSNILFDIAANEYSKIGPELTVKSKLMPKATFVKYIDELIVKQTNKIWEHNFKYKDWLNRITSEHFDRRWWLSDIVLKSIISSLRLDEEMINEFNKQAYRVWEEDISISSIDKTLNLIINFMVEYGHLSYLNILYMNIDEYLINNTLPTDMSEDLFDIYQGRGYLNSKLNLSLEIIGFDTNKLDKLYYKLINKGIISSETKSEQFICAFSGKPIPRNFEKIDWTKNDTLLIYLIRQYCYQGSYMWARATKCFNVKDLANKADRCKENKIHNSDILDNVINSIMR